MEVVDNKETMAIVYLIKPNPKADPNLKIITHNRISDHQIVLHEKNVKK